MCDYKSHHAAHLPFRNSFFWCNLLYASSPMEKKESYRHTLPHFQKQGQAYFVTWSLKDAIPHKVVYKAARKLNLLRLQIKTLEQLPSEFMALARAKKEYFQYRKKYIQAYAEILDNCKSPAINLSDPEIVEILVSTLQFWHEEKLIISPLQLCQIMFIGFLNCIPETRMGIRCICRI